MKIGYNGKFEFTFDLTYSVKNIHFVFIFCYKGLLLRMKKELRILGSFQFPISSFQNYRQNEPEEKLEKNY